MGRSGAVVGSRWDREPAPLPRFPPQRTFDANSASARRQRRTFAVILETGEEMLTCLQRFVSREHVLAAQITAIGALGDVVLMYFDWDKKDYLKIPVREQVEVASLIGDVAEAASSEPALHLPSSGRRQARWVRIGRALGRSSCSPDP
jgi:predicted DNA-binding protein with PD1-like motif